MSAARASQNACKKLAGSSHARPLSGGGLGPLGGGGGGPSPYPPLPEQYCDIPADFSKVDSILRHLQQTESHDWFGEISHCCTQVGYLLLQNYSISRFNFYNYNFHLVVLTSLFFAQRIWFSLWRLTQFTDAHGVRFACHIVLFMVLLDSIYCSMQLVLKDSFIGSLYLVTPLLCSVIFYHACLKANTNVFTAELFGMLGRCVYHSLETGYCVGVLPLRFLQYECIYYDKVRCVMLTTLVMLHTFLSLLCLELHCLGSEVLQQTRMLGEWQWIPDLSRLKSLPKPAEWSGHNCPYPRGAVVRCKGRYYEAMAALNTCTPTCPSPCIYPIAFALGDSERTKALVHAALLFLNAVLVHLVLWSNQWFMYAAMLIPNCGIFLYVKFRKSHAFFNPAHMNLRQLQWNLNSESPYKLNGAGRHLHSGFSLMNSMGHDASGAWGGASGAAAADDMGGEEEGDHSHHSDDVLADGVYGFGGVHLADALGDSARGPNPLFMSAISASTMFFFGHEGGAGGRGDT